MNLIVHHKVKDYATWKPFFDADVDNRKAAGCTGAHLMQSKTDPNDIIISLAFDSMERAQALVDSPKLREVMEQAGVIGMPDVWFVESVERLPS